MDSWQPKISWVYNDGGRAEAGYKGSTGDCVVRAIAIAAELPYQQVYDSINLMAKDERKSKRRSQRSNSRTGVYRVTYERYLRSLGWFWTPTMLVGQGCKVHLREDDLPKGRLIVSVSKHLCAVIDGVVHDLAVDDRNGTRCVYGYYRKH